MKKILSLFLVIVLLICLPACAVQKEAQDTTQAAQIDLPEEVALNPEHPLHEKKVIFIGNSYTHYGNCVITKDVSQNLQAQRQEDIGYFYQICRSQGAKVHVTNWTFGTHSLEDLFGGNCAAGKGCDGMDHKQYLTEPYYDYVFLQEHTGDDIRAADMMVNVEKAAAFFRAANPNVKIFLLVQHRIYDETYQTNRNWLPYLKEVAQKDITIVEWGALVEDVIRGRAVVEGAKVGYTRDSFIVNQSEIDGYHQNMLAGYITAQMAYCAATGEKAEGKPYAFCTNSAIHNKFGVSYYESKHYTLGPTNMGSIFASKDDMLGLQKLIDKYLSEKPYLSY